ncbi:MAG: right-handed parallel beta-helix repeat-containing protein, partial [Pseudomonadota bacterium]
MYAAPTSAPTLAERVQVAGDPDHVESLAADIPASAPTPVSGMLSAPPDTGSEMPHSGMADGTSHVTPDTMPDSMPGSMPDAMEGPADQIDTTMHMDMEMGDLVIEDNNAFLMAMGEGSRIEIHAADAAKESWTQLTQNAIAGDTELHFDESTGWEIGDVIAIAPSGSDYTQDEVRTIKWISEDGKHVRLDAPLEYSHIGVIEQHTNGKTGEDFREYDVDMRAEVALLSRNVTIQGDTDDDGYGAHTMVMHGASQHISGAEFTRVGQIDELGRYPIHWHMGADVSGQYVENISIHEAYNKGVTVHGSFNARVEGNVVFDHIGHGMFTEDGSEYGNQFLGNLVFGTHRSETGQPIPTDRSHVASYWIENTNNTFVGNHAAGSEGFGFFVAPAPLPHGLSAEAYDRAEHPQIISSFSNYIFEDNAAHSAATTGYWQDGFVRADDLTWRAAGASGGNAYIEDFTAYGNGSFGMWFRGSGAYITDSALADNRVNYEFRGGRNVMHDTVVIGRSDTGRSEEYAGIPLAGVNSNEQYLGVVAGYDGTHWANYDEKIALSIRSAGSTQYTWFNNVSTEDANNFHRWKVPGKDGPVATTTKILDLDGSLTGTEGAVLTEILDESYTFRAGPGELTTLDGFRGSVMSEGGAFAQVEFMYVHPTAPSAMTLTRWDGVEYPEWAAQDA